MLKMLRDTSLASPLDNDFVPHYVFLLFFETFMKDDEGNF